MDIQQLRHKHKSALVQHAFKITGHHKDFPAAGKFESEWTDYLLLGGSINQMLLTLKNAKPVNFTPIDPENFNLSNCSINILEDSLPNIWHAEEIHSIKINIFNSTNYFWQTTKKTPIHLSYHWYRNDGEVYVFDGLRTSLSSIVHIDKDNILSLRIKNPKEPGQYFLAVTLVWEGKFWFENKGLNLKKHSILNEMNSITYPGQYFFHNEKKFFKFRALDDKNSSIPSVDEAFNAINLEIFNFKK